MQHLARSYQMAHNITMGTLFRRAYRWATNSEPDDVEIADDIGNFQQTGNVPNYVCEYLARVYGS